MARRVSFSPGIDGMPSPLYFTKHNHDIDKPNMISEPMIKIWAFRPRKNSGFSAMRFLGRIKAKVARAFGLVSSSSRKISSSSSDDSSSCKNIYCSSLERSRSYVEALDSHRAQAIEDCIQFLHSSSSSNSSSSFQRSKSVSAFSY
uniref:uncharacterized protein LOC122608633 n=1 Tax=Erigeron canadensis TaxID=72917 RepID=UPI001CB89B4E|nr:uncharacterized protein LOC122608633 [Erigeron canadensis]